MSFTPYALANLLRKVRYAGGWFRVENERLILTSRDNATSSAPESLKVAIRHHKSSIMAALHSLPSECLHLLACQGVDTSYTAQEDEVIS